MKHIKLVLQRLREKQLYAKMSNCTFGVQEVEYLGFTLQAARIAMNKNKTEAIEAWETSKYMKELQSFLGLINYYRRFIRNCSKIAKPLTDLTKNVPFMWSNEGRTSISTTQKGDNKCSSLASVLLS